MKISQNFAAFSEYWNINNVFLLLEVKITCNEEEIPCAMMYGDFGSTFELFGSESEFYDCGDLSDKGCSAEQLGAKSWPKCLEDSGQAAVLPWGCGNVCL